MPLPISPSLRNAARVLRDEFSRVDGAADGRRDGLITRQELAAVAQRDGSRELRAAATVALTQDGFNALDSRGPGGALDGRFARSAVNEALGTPAWRPPAPDRAPIDFKVATWNVENFFDSVNDSSRTDERATGGVIPTAAAVSAKSAALAGVLKGISADVVALQEVETRALLDDLANRVDPVRYPPSHRVFVDSGTPEGRNVALLTRYPVLRVVNHSRESLGFAPGTRDAAFKHHLLEVELNVNGQTVVVLVQHQAARADSPGSTYDPTRAFREAEARYARDVANRLRAENPRRPVVVMGDFNDQSTDASVGDWLQQGYGSATKAVPSAHRYTNVYRPQPGVELRRDFNHILASPDFAPTARSVFIHHEARRPGLSDHAPVEATFKL